MAAKDKTSSQVEALAGTRDARTGLLHWAVGDTAYAAKVGNALHHLALAAAFWLLVKESDSNNTSVQVQQGHVPVGNALINYAGGTVDLAAHDDDTAYVWAYNSGTHAAPVAAIGFDSDGNGWPSVDHVKLATVTLVSGAITSIVDLRGQSVVRPAHADPHYDFAITVQGDTGTPSTVTITLKDAQGQTIPEADRLRVRVCDQDGETDATNATIAAGTNTTAIKSHTANKDIDFKSHTNGVFTITLTNATAETVTLRIGMAELSGRRAEYKTTQDVAHAAP